MCCRSSPAPRGLTACTPGETTTQQWSRSVIDFFLSLCICSQVQSGHTVVASHEMAERLNSCMIFMLALSSTSKWCKERGGGGLCWFRTIFLVESCRLVLLDIWTDAGQILSHHLLALPLCCPVSIVTPCSRHHSIVLTLYFSFSSRHHRDLDSFSRTAA